MVLDVILAWSGGKDSALALHSLFNDPYLEVAYLLSTVTDGYERVSMHGVRRELLLRQASSLGLELVVVRIPKGCRNEDYDETMQRAMTDAKARGIERVAFGDIFLEDVRRYREGNLSKVDMEAVFPLWGRDTSELAREFLELGFKGIVTCVDTEQLDGGFAGRRLDGDFIEDLPPDVDPCGENGEFHTFVYDGPPFKSNVAFDIGEKVLRDGRFMYCDLVPRS